jgi:ATP-binding cassette, subfamily B, bacterial
VRTSTGRTSFDRGTVRQGFRIIGRSVRMTPVPFTIAVIGSAVYATMTVASALVFGWVTDEVILPAFDTGATTRALLVLASAVIIGVAVLKAAGIVTRRIGATYMQAKLEAIHRRRIAEQYQRLPMSWHSRHSTGELLSRANNDVESAFWPMAPLPFATGVVLMLFLGAGVFLLTDLVLALLAFVIGPVMGYANWHYNRLMNEPATRAQELRADVSEVAHESFDGAMVVKTLGREAEETSRFRISSEDLRDTLIDVARLRSMYNPFIESLPNVGVLLVLLAGAWRIQAGAITTGELVQLAFLFTLLAFPIRVIGYLLSEFPRAVVGWDRIRHVLDADEQLDYGDVEPNQVEEPAETGVVEVTFAYDDTGDEGSDEPVLRDVSFEALRGQVVAVVGPTGAGKSTIASLLVRLADPSAGEIRLDGRDLRALAHGAIADEVAIVFQESFLFADTVRENVTLGEDFSDDEVVAATELAQAHEFIAGLPQGYDTVVGERGATLSGGQRQRVALARALVRRPRLLILDDATSSVDPQVEQRILRGLRRAELPSTIVVVAYRKATIALADTIVFVEEGGVRNRGTHEQLVATDAEYTRLLDAYERERGT